MHFLKNFMHMIGTSFLSQMKAFIVKYYQYCRTIAQFSAHYYNFFFGKKNIKIGQKYLFCVKKTRNNFCIFCYLCISTDKSIYLTHIQNLSVDDISLATHFDWKSDTHILLFLSCYFCKQSFR